MKINLSLFLVLSILTAIFFHKKSNASSLEAFFSLILTISLLSIIFLTLQRLITLGNQKLFMLGYSGMIIWIAAVIGGELLYLKLMAQPIDYFYSLIACVIFLLVFLIAHLNQLLNHLSQK